MENNTEKTNLGPTWESLINIFLQVLYHGQPDARGKVVEELRKMAKQADKWNRLMNN